MVLVGERNDVSGGVDPTGWHLQIELFAVVSLKPMATALPMAFEIATVEGPLVSHVGDGIEWSIALGSPQ